MSDINTTSTAASAGTKTGTYQDGDELHSLQTYVSDLLALEQHINQPLDAQLDSDDTARYPAARSVIQEIKAQNESHVQTLKRCLDDLGGHPAGPIKSAWSNLLGDAAAAIGASRKTKVTKWLRDDYTALSLASMSYTLLHATAVGLGDGNLAEIAKSGLADYARCMMKINEAVPEVVLGELQDDGIEVATGASETIRQQTQDVWRRQGQSLHGDN
jgi:ferritin-like metal-binding protein YciE